MTVVSCTTLTDDLQTALDRIGEARSLPVAAVDPETLAVLETYGWVYEWQGTLDATGAGAWHAGTVQQSAGMLE